MSVLKNLNLEQNGYLLTQFPLDKCVSEYVLKRQWNELDRHLLEISKPGGSLYSFLQDYLDFNFLEHIIAIRSAPGDDEGIWHDDGSRLLGFSLSLNIEPSSIAGGELRFKAKDSRDMERFSPLPFGQIVLFLTGVFGYEHQVGAVTQGERIVIAGWCSSIETK